VASLADIRAGIAANCSAVSGIQVSPYLLANPTTPSAHIFPEPTDPIEYDVTMGRGTDKIILIVQVFVAFTTDIGSQVSLDEYLAGSGARSFKQAIESDPTLNATGEDLRVTGVTRYQRYVLPSGGECLAADFRVQVLVSG